MPPRNSRLAGAADEAAPPWSLLLREAGALLDLRWRSLAARAPWRPAALPAVGAPVVVIPGFLAGDGSTRPLRAALAAAGHPVHGWGLGVNLGARADLLDRLEALLARVAADRPASLVGWSLGGLFARELAKRRPDRVTRVITLGSPFSGDPRANHAWRLYELVSGHPVDNPPLPVSLKRKPPVPTVALWSRGDGVVAPACARGLSGEADRSIEVACSHMGFMTCPRVAATVLALLGD